MLPIDCHTEDLLWIPPNLPNSSPTIFGRFPSSPIANTDRADCKLLREVSNQFWAVPSSSREIWLNLVVANRHKRDRERIKKLRLVCAAEVWNNLALDPAPVNISLIQFIDLPGQRLITREVVDEAKAVGRLAHSHSCGEVRDCPLAG